MKLNPPANSSDLDVARDVARRLHDRSLQREGSAGQPAGPDPVSAPAPVRPTPPPSTPEPIFKPPDFERPLPESEGFAPAEPTPSADEPEGFEPPQFEPAAPASEPELEVPAEPEPSLPESQEPAESPESELESELESEPAEPDSPSFEPTFEPSDFEPPAFEPPGLEPPTTEEPPAPYEAAPPTTDAWDTEPDDALSELAGTPPEPSFEGLEPPGDPYGEAPGAAVSPEDLLGGGPDAEPETESPFDVVGEPGTGELAEQAPEDLLASPGPSWDDVAESCLELTGAHGAMLVDTSGQVLTARGEWPEPGPDAIAGRLVSMMERTLQDAPTRSVSAPIAGQHLTAWRIPASEGYLTVVFMGNAPLSADVRPDIDEHVRQALGS